MHRIGFNFILRLHSSHQFSGTLPARVVATIGKIVAGIIHRRVPPPASVLSATAASVSRHKRQVSITAPVGLQVGVLLGPALP